MHWKPKISQKIIFSNIDIYNRMFTSELNVCHKLLILQEIGNES